MASVLDQVIGADREEVETSQERANGQGGGRDFDHAANQNVFVKGDALSVNGSGLWLPSAAGSWG